MTKIFLSTHGSMASGMESALHILLGNTECLTVFDAYLPKTNDTVEEHVEAFLDGCTDTETKILMSDLLGGSVNQVLIRYANRPNTYVITGVNLALLLELAASSSHDYTEEELNHIVEEARKTTQMVGMVSIQKGETFF